MHLSYSNGVYCCLPYFLLSVFFFLPCATPGLIYLPEIKFRRTLQTAFGPGGWALMPRGEPTHYQVAIN